MSEVLDLATAPATSEPTGSRPPDAPGTDLERIFSDIIATAVIRAASIPFSLEEYRRGIELMASHLHMIITSMSTIERDLLTPLGPEQDAPDAGTAARRD